MTRLITFIVALLLFSLQSAFAANCDKVVYLTLDSGNMVSAEKIARILKEHHVLATFFVTNKVTFRHDHTLDDSWANYWQERVKEGHEFGSHTLRHWYFRRDLDNGKVLYDSGHGEHQELDQDALCQELKSINERFLTLTGQPMSPLWRAPGGHVTARTNQFAQACGYTSAVGWSAAGFLGDELPSERYPNQMLLHRALSHIHSGDIIMMHLGIQSRHDPFVNVLEPLITGLQSQGFCFKTLPTP